MGSGLSSLPDKFTEQDLQGACIARCNDSYVNKAVFENHTLFNTLRSEDGCVKKNTFLSICNDSSEQEVLRLFLSFCDGNMDIDRYTKFCHYTKLLSKRRLSRQEAHAIFNTHKRGQPKLNFFTFREEIIPAIAAKRGDSINDLILRLSRVETPENIDTIDTFSTGPSFDENEIHMGEGHSSVSRSRLKAAVRIQSICRAFSARDESEKKRVLQRLESQPIGISASASSKGAFDADKKLMDMFLRISPSGEMTCREFLQLCHDTEIIPLGDVDKSTPIFTAKQAKFVFQKTIAKYFDPVQNRYEEGVMHGKRITFEVFRSVTLVDVAEEKQMSVDDLVLFLTSHSTGQLTRRRYYAEDGIQLVHPLFKTIP